MVSSSLSQRGLGGSNPRWRQVLLCLVVIVLTLGLGAAQGRKKKPKAAPPPKDLPGQVNYLARQFYGLAMDESGALTGQIQKLVLDHLQKWIANRTPTGVEVRRELENVFAQVAYPIYAQPACFDEPWKGGVLIGAGYTLGWSDYDRANVVALFESQGGQTRLAAATNFVPRTDLHYAFLPPAASGDFRFFVYGFRLGKSQLRLTAILHSFDGQTLKPLWETRDVYDGKMDVGRERVVIRYLKEEEYARELAHGRKPPRHEAVYRVTESGLELESEREIPF